MFCPGYCFRLPQGNDWRVGFCRQFAIEGFLVLTAVVGIVGENDLVFEDPTSWLMKEIHDTEKNCCGCSVRRLFSGSVWVWNEGGFWASVLVFVPFSGTWQLVDLCISRSHRGAAACGARRCIRVHAASGVTHDVRCHGCMVPPGVVTFKILFNVFMFRLIMFWLPSRHLGGCSSHVGLPHPDKKAGA